MTLRSSNKTCTEDIDSPSSKSSPNSQLSRMNETTNSISELQSPRNSPFAAATHESHDIPRMNDTQSTTNSQLSRRIPLSSISDLQSPHDSPFAAATHDNDDIPCMNDTQSTTNNSLRDPDNNGTKSPMDIDQDDDTDTLSW
eukprot:472814_1